MAVDFHTQQNQIEMLNTMGATQSNFGGQGNNNALNPGNGQTPWASFMNNQADPTKMGQLGQLPQAALQMLMVTQLFNALNKQLQGPLFNGAGMGGAGFGGAGGLGGGSGAGGLPNLILQLAGLGGAGGSGAAGGAGVKPSLLSLLGDIGNMMDDAQKLQRDTAKAQNDPSGNGLKRVVRDLENLQDDAQQLASDAAGGNGQGNGASILSLLGGQNPAAGLGQDPALALGLGLLGMLGQGAGQGTGPGTGTGLGAGLGLGLGLGTGTGTGNASGAMDGDQALRILDRNFEKLAGGKGQFTNDDLKQAASQASDPQLQAAAQFMLANPSFKDGVDQAHQDAKGKKSTADGVFSHADMDAALSKTGDAAGDQATMETMSKYQDMLFKGRHNLTKDEVRQMANGGPTPTGEQTPPELQAAMKNLASKPELFDKLDAATQVRKGHGGRNDGKVNLADVTNALQTSTKNDQLKPSNASPYAMMGSNFMSALQNRSDAGLPAWLQQMMGKAFAA